MAGLLLSLGSCVSKKEFTKLQTDYTYLQSLYNQSQVDLASSRTRVKSLEERLADAPASERRAQTSVRFSPRFARQEPHSEQSR